jgi:prophage antirepressor-like protein
MIKRFVFEGNNLTVVEMDGKPYWIAKEVGRALGYSNDGRGLIDFFVRDWSKEFDEGEDYVKLEGKQLSNFKQILKDHEDFSLSSELKFTSRIILFTKEGIFGVLQLTKKEEGHRMRKWLRREVLPSIQETGGYFMNNGISISATRKQLAQKWKETAQMLIDSENEKEIVERKRQIAEVALGKAVKRIDDIEPAANVGRNFIANANSMKLSSAAKRLKVGEMTISVPMFLEYLKYRKVIEYISSPNKNGPDEKEIYPKHNFLPWFEQHSEYISSSNKNKNGSDKKKMSPKSGFESWFEQHRSNISKKGLQWVLKPEGFAEMKQRMLEDPDFFRWSVEFGSKELRDEVENGEGNPEWEWKVKRKEERKKIDEWLCKDEY